MADTPPEPLRLQVLEKLSALITAAFGLVAALAWNDAIKALIAAWLGPGEQLTALFLYALTVTVLAVIAAIWVGRVVGRLRDDLARERARTP